MDLETLSPYLLAHCTPADDVLSDLAEETHRMLPADAGMQITHDEGAFLTLLVQLTGVRTAVEVGTFTGYSSICIARGLAPGGRLHCFDVSEDFTSVARRYWRRAGLDDRIALTLGPAVDHLSALTDEIDFAFIDADKTGYPAYYDALVPKLRPGGVIALDNVLRDGRVLDPAATSPADIAIKQLNDRIVTDERVTSVMLPVRDGVTVVRRV